MNRTLPPADTDLRVFRDPASVAVVGATADPAKWGYWLAKGALAGRHRREVYLVNRSGAEILGEASHRCLGELPATPELVALCVPPAHIGAVVDEALALGARGFLGITAGVPDEAAIARRITDAGARLVGMNSLGIYDSSTELRLAWGDFTPGPIAVISQSGQLGSEIANLAARAGLGVSRFVSIGNQSDVRAGELLGDLIADGTTRVVALYLESFSAGEHLIDTLTRLRGAGKHTVLLTVGGSEASTRLARSHTGSLTSNLDVVDAAAGQPARSGSTPRVNWSTWRGCCSPPRCRWATGWPSSETAAARPASLPTSPRRRPCACRHSPMSCSTNSRNSCRTAPLAATRWTSRVRARRTWPPTPM